MSVKKNRFLTTSLGFFVVLAASNAQQVKTSEGYYQYVRHAMDARTVGRLVCLDSNSRLTSNGCQTVTLNTDQVTEGSGNLYFTQARVRAALSALAPLIFNSSTGQFSMPVSNSVTNGYLAATDWVAFNAKAGTGTCPGGQAVTQTTTAGVTCASVSSLPSQTGNAGKYLTTDGTNASWGTVAAGGYSTAKVAGVSQTQRNNLNFAVGSGITVAGSDDGTNTTITIGSDTSALLTRSTAQSGVDQYCASASASGTAYTCTTPGTALAAYTNGMTRVWKPDVNGGASPTLAVDGLAAKRIYASDGTSAPTISANNAYLLTYDSSLNSAAGGWRMPAGGSAGGGTRSIHLPAGNCGSTGSGLIALWNPNSSLGILCLGSSAYYYPALQINQGAYWGRTWIVPEDWSAGSSISVKVRAIAADSTAANTLGLSVAVSCSGTIASPTFNSDVTVNTASFGGSANAYSDIVFSGVTMTSCTKGQIAIIRIRRETDAYGSYYAYVADPVIRYTSGY